jgi:hypothetical protein
MTSLHATVTLGATAHVHVEPPDHRPHNRQILLVLCGDARADDRPATVRACMR